MNSLQKSFYKISKKGIQLYIFLTPGAAKESIDGPLPDAEGNIWLKIRVTAPPEDGRANASLLKFLAKHLRIPRSSLSIISGETQRRKVILVDYPIEDIGQLLWPS